MPNTPRIVLVGGGSVGWSPKLINDLMLTPGLEASRFVILDTNPSAADRMVQLGGKLARERGLACAFEASGAQDQALRGADFVLITITTGGLDAMAHDLAIPENYRIYQTVGDTVGPGGWARAFRNIPVFVGLAKSIKAQAPNAVILNYTNPMATLTKVLSRVSGLRTVGLCHGLFEVYDVLERVFGLKDESEISVRFGGTNHFFWILDLAIRGQDGYAMLRSKLAGRSFHGLVQEAFAGVAGFHSDKLVTSELFEAYGYLPYIGDRHISEFLPSYLTGDLQRISRYKLVRTSIDDRRRNQSEGEKRLTAFLRGEEHLPRERSRETAADIIGAFVNHRPFVDVVNLPNVGQIDNLPRGAVVETLGAVSAVGFTPLCAGELPEEVLGLVLPHVRNQDLIVEAALEEDLDQALCALIQDPLCSHLSLTKIREMGRKLLAAEKQFLPEGLRSAVA